MRSIFIIIILVFTVRTAAQGPVGSWTDRLSYAVSYDVTAGSGRVWSSSGSSVLVWDLDSDIASSISRVNGLSETRISSIAWAEEEESLIIVYSNTNVDIIKKGVVTNIPDIKNKYIPGLKEIYSITVTGSRALLSGSFGIVVVDIRGRVIADTWRPGPDGDNNTVYQTAILGDRAYAATEEGVFSAPVARAGLSYYGNWERMTELNAPGEKYSAVASTASSLFICRPGVPGTADSLFRVVPGQHASLILSEPGVKVRSVDSSGDGVAVSLTSAITFFSAAGEKIREITTYGWSAPNPRRVITYAGYTWIADASNGLISASASSEFRSHTLPGPYTNNVADITFNGSEAYITGGTVDNAWNNVYRPFQVFINSGDEWESNILYGSADRDAMRVIAVPGDQDHYFVSSWGNGVYEFDGITLVNNFNQYNSPLTSIFPGSAFSRVCGLAFDNDMNLWMTQSGVPGNIKVLMKDGTWRVTLVDIDCPVAGDMLIAHNNYIWVILPRGYGMLVYDPHRTPGDLSDDRYMQLQVQDADGHVMNNLFSLAEDLDGNIWVGTDAGPVVYYSPEKIFDGTSPATRVKVPRNDGSGLADYLLGTETITAIAVDGANRKWFGTMSSGAYLVSEDGRQQILGFNASNSPLLSDNIVTIAINGLNGEVWLGTDAGIVSFRGNAITGREDYSGMYVFPNPVREDFGGDVTITGLVEYSTVKITDISGNLVFETISNGGQASWNLMNYKGDRVASGIYLVFVTNSDGSVSAVTKFMVISQR